ncbi:TPA: glycosyltransferase family 2 protein, partial [Enterococcus faecium]|nr:glycosyltransferase family 2 protein [Enterococcus faecium]HAP9510683.1 glycosyltransferase family 2 protein [Enterococcus faecium]
MNQNLEKQTKLSIIIPFYNAKNTLKRAVDSVLTQGYPNIEILLIDDGSTDGSSDIGDEIANLESKVACYHLENAGPSVARNCGIKEATGNLVGFLDSDDYFLPDCFNNVLKDYHRNYPDIIAFGLSKGKNIENANLFVPEKKIGCSSEEAIEQMFRSKAVDFYVWNKFFKRELFNHIVFPENKLYEDMVPMYEAFRAASKIDILPFSGIFYYQNNDS